MKLVSFFYVVFIATFLFFSAPSSAFYQQGGQSSKPAISSQQAAQIVKGRFGGKVLKVTRSKSSNNPVYRVKIVKGDGHIITVIVDGNTGKIKGQ
ncbi:PepSY domain-containing protein [Colwellia sp. D2M02]|uniref:PepSY domain-containing protein n=1 Tax=Colwellia sp. D2M02 TaxID=2841562 RepID=UPI001C09845B|nr:PepSY domain-containing protein [Colwellia sp. D2M02]MBU2892628.1 PepSY domain-containing protein [Colwellia sp. D2M02]